MTVLVLLLLIPLLGAGLVVLAGRVSANAARVSALMTLVVELALAIALAFDTAVHPVSVTQAWIPSFGVSFALEADWLSALLVVLTALLAVASVLVSWKEITERVSSFHVLLLFLIPGVNLVFLARDMMLFYLGWELMLIPMLFLIGGWGTGRKEYAATKFVLFTFGGSIFMLVSLLYVYVKYASQNGGTYSFLFSDLLRTKLDATEQWWVFLGLLIGFGVKMPLVPLHTWLQDAYPNAPTAGSLLLSGILSKTGVYGFIRFALELAPDAWPDFQPWVMGAAFIGIFYGAWCAFSQTDFKSLIAYSSLSHIGFIVLGICLGSKAGMHGSILQMVNHGLTTAALFMIAGIVQRQLQSREFDSAGGLWGRAPALGGFLLFFTFASLGIPGTGNFIGELFIVGAGYQQDWRIGALAALGVFFGAAYALRLFTALMHGPENPVSADFQDIDRRDWSVLTVLTVLVIYVGFFPGRITQFLDLPQAHKPADASSWVSAPNDRSQETIYLAAAGQLAQQEAQ